MVFVVACDAGLTTWKNALTPADDCDEVGSGGDECDRGEYRIEVGAAVDMRLAVLMISAQ